VKPPVEEPKSAATRPVTSMRKCCNAPLQSAASHVALFRRHFDAGFGRHQLSGLGCFLTVDQDIAGHDRSLSFLAGVGKAAVYHRAIEAGFFVRGFSRSGFHDFR